MEERFDRLIDFFNRNAYLQDVMGVLFLPVSLLYMETVAKMNLFGGVFDEKYKYMLFLSLAMGCLFSAVAMLIPGRVRRIISQVPPMVREFTCPP